MLSKWRSSERIANISKSLKNTWQKKGHNWSGRKHSDQTKNAIGKANSVSQLGEGNSQYGKCWVYNEELKISKSIDKKLLDNFIKNGWKKGRKINFNTA